MCILGSLTTVARELARYKLDKVRVQEVRWDKGGIVRAEYYILFRECLLSFGAESFVFQFAIQKYKD